MNVSIKFATGLILAATALVASGSAALAGEGGAAGSVSIKFAGTSTVPAGAPVGAPAVPDVSRLSTSVAVGKSFAVAGARTAGTETNTFASGAGGGFVLNNANSNAADFTATTETISATVSGANQVNTFAGSGTATLAPTTGITLAD
jgi:hypothetical protein